MDYRSYFKGKKITVMGLGLLGRGVGDVKFLAEQGTLLIVTDLKTEKELTSSLAQLKQFKNITFVLGEHRLEDFKNRDFILKAAGVPLDSPYIAEARKNKIPVLMSTALFVSLLPSGVITIGVTGTRGKSTVTHLINEILKAAGKRTHLGGNERGVSTLALLPEVEVGDITVLELDSWQLQGFGDLQISPQIAVFTNFYPDHLNYYLPAGRQVEQAMKLYYADKANIFKFQKEGDYLVKGEEVALPADWQLQIPGEHNRQNAAMAKKVAEILEIDPDIIKKVITEFAGLPGRLELIRTVNGIKIYNDTNSTTPDALEVGLKSLGQNKNIILIMGGADKNLDFTKVIPLILQHCKAVILLPGSGTDKVAIQGEKVATLPEAVSEAMKLAQPGDILLFSPAFASFGPPPGGFVNEYDRGEQFNRVILGL